MPVILLVVASLPLTLFFGMPLLALLSRTVPQTILDHLTTPTVRSALTLSLYTSLLAVVGTLLCGTPLAYLLARRSFPGRDLVTTLVALPMVLPPSVIGIGLLLTFGQRGLLGATLQHAGVNVAFTTTAVVLAQLFAAAPFYLKTAITAFAQIEPEVEQAAGLDGATPFQIFRWITLPLARPMLLAGTVMSWARAVGEFGATILFAGNFSGQTQTLPLAIYVGFETDLDIALTLSVILLTFACGVLLTVKGILHHWITDLEGR